MKLSFRDLLFLVKGFDKPECDRKVTETRILSEVTFTGHELIRRMTPS